MKLRKVLSVLCAVAILTSALPAAFAVEAEDLSEYAGGTVACQVYEMTENGPIAVTYNVPIPAGATKEAEREIVRSYVMAAGNSGTLRAAGRVAYEEISKTEKKIAITTAWTNVGSGKAKNNYDELYVEFTDFVNDGATKLTVQVQNVELGMTSNEKEVNLSLSALYVYFLVKDRGFANKDNTIIATAKTDKYNVKTNCTVLGSVN